MLIKLFGVMDLLSALLLLLLKYGVGETLAYFFAGYLLLKGLLFFGGVNTFFDLVGGILLILAAQGVYSLFYWIVILWLFQKGLFSLLG
jgi:hypothetical protein